MRLLFHIEPLVMHSRPLHYWAWLDRAAEMARTLAAADRGHSFRFLLNRALAARALAPRGESAGTPRRGQGLPRDWVVPVSQDLVRRHFDASNVAILEGFQHGRWPQDQVSACGADVRASLDGFAPDIIVTFTPAPHLAAAFPEALVLHSEFGIFSRPPFPVTHYFDPLGLYARSMLGVHAAELLARRPDAAERDWLDALRHRYRDWLLAASPFHELECSLRACFRRLALLPLQFGGEAGFEVNGPFRNQGEYLFHVLERLPVGVALIVTEHPSARRLGDFLDDETRAYVREAWPQVSFVDPSVIEHGSQMLLLHVDDVIGLSSSLGLQAIFWQKPLFTVGWSHLRPYAEAGSIERIDPARPRGEIADRDGAVGWMLRHYFVPERLCVQDAGWIEHFLGRALERTKAGDLGLDFHEPVAGVADLDPLLSPGAPVPAHRHVRPGLMRNGHFERWTDGMPRYWELVAHSGARVAAGLPECGPQMANGGAAPFAQLEGARDGKGPTLLLQRVSDLDELAGAFVSLEFAARGPLGGALTVYLYQQFDAENAPVQGTPAHSFVLSPEWRRFVYSATVPQAPGSPRGPNHHTEIVFMLPEGGAVRADIGCVTLGPGRLEG